ncbi:MAG: methyltransferase domain-containing protein [Dehalococcoidia bacterium]
MSDAVEGDIWSEWLLKRRFPSDPEVAAQWSERLGTMRAGVLERAKIEPGGVVLDVGAGDGLIAFGALERVGPSGRVIFSDISQPLLDESRRIATDLDVLARCEFLNASAHDLSAIADGSVDVVTTRSVLIYVKEKAGSFQEFFRVLRPGGRMSLFEPINRAGLDYRDVFKARDPRPEIRDLAERMTEYWATLQPPDDAMVDFDERDLLRMALEAGFEDVHLQLDVDVTLSPPTSWEGWISSAGNPKIPSLREAMEELFNNEERERYERVLRPVVEAGGQPLFSAIAWLQAIKRQRNGGPHER